MNQETKLIIGIPTINRADLLNEALMQIQELGQPLGFRLKHLQQMLKCI